MAQGPYLTAGAVYVAALEHDGSLACADACWHTCELQLRLCPLGCVPELGQPVLIRGRARQRDLQAGVLCIQQSVLHAAAQIAQHIYVLWTM
jgi:hypothetical protein